MTNCHNLTLGHCNIQGGLVSLHKTLEIGQLIRKHSLDILSINETNLNDSIDSSTLNLPTGFNIIRKDRGVGSRGGCAVLVSKNCAHNVIDLDLGYDGIEAIWIKIKSTNIVVCGFYRSSRFCKVDKFLDYMVDCMNKLKGKRVIWIGDINLDQNKINSPDYKKLDATLRAFGMIQVIRETTRAAKRGDRFTETIIDVIMTNCYSDMKSSEVLPERIGDHQALKCEVDFKVKKAPKFEKRVIRDHCQSNIKAYYDYLKTSDYSPLLECVDADAVAEGLNLHITANYDTFFPLKTIKTHPSFIFRPSQKTLDAIKHKKKLYRNFKKILDRVKRSSCNSCKNCALCVKCREAWDKYKEARNNSNLSSRLNKKENLVKDLRAKSARNDLKGVWKSIKLAANMPPKSNKQSNSSLTNMCPESLNSHFCTVGPSIQSSINDPSSISFEEFMTEVPIPNCIMSDFEPITSEQVLNYVKSISTDKAIADVIPMKIYHSIIKLILEPLTHIINLSLATGTIPSLCKYAKVTAIHKGGDPTDENNYRPISILPFLGKCIEYFVNDQLSRYVETNNILSPQQFGFRKDHSTTYLMYDLFDNIYDSKANGNIPSILFLDIKKAFDTVDHEILIKKLKFYGIDGTVILWLENYLKGRRQCTKIGKKVSLYQLITCGVPQGSILGPLLFSLYINDMALNCHLSTPYFFADDGALMFEDTCRNSYLAMKIELITISKWLKANKLLLNAEKSNFMVFDNVNDNSCIDIEGLAIKETKSIKYLGLILDHRLRFDLHVDHVKKKVLKRIGALYRASNLLAPKYKKMFANSLMLPQFDYLDTIYSRANKTKLAELDVLYKKVAKITLGVSRTESSIIVYNDMKWLPLHLRRQLHLSSYMFKIVNEFCPANLKNKFSYISGGTRDGENCNLIVKRSRSMKHFSYLGSRTWNIIPPGLRTFTSNPPDFSKAFKTRLLKSIASDPNYRLNNAFDYFYKINNDITSSSDVAPQIQAVLQSIGQ